MIPDIGHAVCARSDKYAMCVARATCGALWSLIGLGESFVRSFLNIDIGLGLGDHGDTSLRRLVDTLDTGENGE